MASLAYCQSGEENWFSVSFWMLWCSGQFFFLLHLFRFYLMCFLVLSLFTSVKIRKPKNIILVVGFEIGWNYSSHKYVWIKKSEGVVKDKPTKMFYYMFTNESYSFRNSKPIGLIWWKEICSTLYVGCTKHSKESICSYSTHIIVHVLQ